jgi:hypothetical protein
LATKIEREFAFQAAVYFEGEFLMTIYELALKMEVDTASIKEQNIAMDRIHYFLHECLGNSIFVQETEKKAIEKYMQADIKVCTLPDEPYDQIITILLLLKLNAITAGKLHITDISLMSGLSDDVKFVYDVETVANHPFGNKGWWSDCNTTITDITKINKKDKIVRLVKQHCDWASVGLDWEQKEHTPTEIIFSNDHEKQPL